METGTGSLRYRVHCACFAFGSVTHLLLADALQDDWLIPDVLYWIGLAIVAIRGHVVGWALCLVGLAWPLLFLRDQLTHSVYFALCCVAAILCWLAGPRGARETAVARGLPPAVRLLTVGTYAAAAFHKLNRDFLDPSVSCATAGMEVLAENWSLPWLAPGEHAVVWPVLFLIAEVAVAVLFVVRPAAALLIAVPMHVPLTLVFAPEFAFVMMGGWVMTLRERDLAHLIAVLRRRWPVLAGVAVAAEAVSMSLYFQDHWEWYPWWFFKEALLYFLFAWLLAAWLARRRRGVFAWWGAWRERPSGSARAIGIVLGVLWGLNALTPYVGLSFHHAGAMLSNLRIDRGCWNHLLVPEALRLREPYLRIDRAEVRGVRDPDAYRAVLEEGLWNREALDLAREQMCRRRAAIRIAGRAEAGAFDFDLCDHAAWPFGDPLLPRFRAFQWNLARECPQRCVH